MRVRGGTWGGGERGGASTNMPCSPRCSATHQRIHSLLPITQQHPPTGSRMPAHRTEDPPWLANDPLPACACVNRPSHPSCCMCLLPDPPHPHVCTAAGPEPPPPAWFCEAACAPTLPSPPLTVCPPSPLHHHLHQPIPSYTHTTLCTATGQTSVWGEGWGVGGLRSRRGWGRCAARAPCIPLALAAGRTPLSSPPPPPPPARPSHGLPAQAHARKPRGWPHRIPSLSREPCPPLGLPPK